LDELRFVDLFAGIGGFRLGIERVLGSKAKCVFTNEWDKYSCQVYNHNFNDSIRPVDIRHVSECDLPEFDLLCGGFPCQAFSIAGRRQGFEDTRGTMFFEVARILKAKKPSFVLLENVKGLLSHD
jgi:DNA (cytosine-5)-methyltransferase 1